MNTRACGGIEWKENNNRGSDTALNAIMFIESRILRPHVRPPEARWPGLCATKLRRHEGGRASSRDDGYTETEAVADGTVGEGGAPGLCGNVASKPETREARQ